MKSARLWSILLFSVLLGSIAGKSSAVPAQVPWKSTQLITAEELKKILSTSSAKKPVIVHVGFRVLYNNGHIPGAVFAGPASTPEGIKVLQKALTAIPKDRTVVIYCGCCPWKDCPNMLPAFLAAQNVGIKKFRLLYLGRGLLEDWIKHGYPIEKS